MVSIQNSLLRICWCGNDDLESFSPDYSLCHQCGTLVSQTGLTDDQLKVADDEHDFYGKNYWFSHQVEEFGFPDIRQRARQDLPERCLYWLKTLLKYRHPPAKVLELGCAHGGFVSLLKHSGFDASGLEVSPWVVEFAKQTFDIPVLLGPIEEQDFQQDTFDIICLFDVLEHLLDPLATMRHVTSLLNPDGILVVQMPSFDGESYAELQDTKSSFLGVMQPEHIHLFTEKSARQLLESLDFSHIKFETSLYPYDMFLVASKQAVIEVSDKTTENSLLAKSHSRIVQALLDKDASNNSLEERNQETLSQYQSLLEQHRSLIEQYQSLLNQYQNIEESRTKSLTDVQVQSEQIIAQLKQIEALAKERENLKREKGTLENEKIYLIEIKKILAARQEALGQEKIHVSNAIDHLVNNVHELEKHNLILQQQLSELERKMERSQSSTNRLKKNLETLKEALKRITQSKEDVERQLEHANQVIEIRDNEIDAMKSSKFWKLRLKWFKVKGFLGFQPDE